MTLLPTTIEGPVSICLFITEQESSPITTLQGEADDLIPMTVALSVLVMLYPIFTEHSPLELILLPTIVILPLSAANVLVEPITI
jgi:hypothetical protein